MGRFDRRARTGMLVGALAMFFALDVAFLLSMAGMPFVADSLGQAIIDVLPGFISIPLIDALHQWAKILLVVGVVALFLIDGAATGLLAASPRRRTAVVLGVGLLPWIAAVGAGGLGNVTTVARRLRTRADIPAADPGVDALPGITPRITANEDHYVVDTTLVKPRVLIEEWRLDIKGLVQSPFSLTYDQLLDLEAVEQIHTLECISNYVGGDLISTALWTGVPLRDLLNRAQVQAGAYDVVFTSVDGYTDSIPIAKAMEDRTLVAYLMNGKTVPQDHGYPARMLVPNIYGMKNVKWIRTIEVVNYDFIGYWQQQGWSDSANINTNARIDLPGRSVRWTGDAITVAGIAFAGARGISKVELSSDGGKSWAQAALEVPMGPLSWRRWSYDWTPSGAGPVKLIVRATDGTGNTETPIARSPYPDGSTGYDSIDVTVQRG